VYIVPPDRHVTVTDHEIRLETGDAERPKPSVDRLLETAAGVFGQRLIAVILSGTDSDGAAGAQYVAAVGGTVIAQDPETASFPSMPRSLLPQTVDAVIRLEAIGPLIESLVAGRTNLNDSEDGVETFLGQLRDRSGIDFTAYSGQLDGFGVFPARGRSTAVAAACPRCGALRQGLGGGPVPPDHDRDARGACLAPVHGRARVAVAQRFLGEVKRAQ
jgi:hypothetical protein